MSFICCFNHCMIISLMWLVFYTTWPFYLFNSVRVLHASAFPDIHLCCVDTSRLKGKHRKTDSKSNWPFLYTLVYICQSNWRRLASHEWVQARRYNLTCTDGGLPRVGGRPKRLSPGCQGSSSRFYPFSCQSCRWDQPVWDRTCALLELASEAAGEARLGWAQGEIPPRSSVYFRLD